MENDGTEGTLEVEIPKELLGGQFTVMIDNEPAKYDITADTATHSVLLLLKPAGSSLISIHGTTVIPEFPLVLPVLVIALGALIVLVRRKNISNELFRP